MDTTLSELNLGQSDFSNRKIDSANVSYILGPPAVF